jgi:hypothetical protein
VVLAPDGDSTGRDQENAATCESESQEDVASVGRGHPTEAGSDATGRSPAVAAAAVLLVRVTLASEGSWSESKGKDDEARSHDQQAPESLCVHESLLSE